MDPDIVSSTDGGVSGVFVGPVTQRELILTWQKRRQLKLEQDSENADNSSRFKSSDEIPPSHQNTAEPRYSPSDGPSVDSSFYSASAIDNSPTTLDEEIVAGLNVVVTPTTPETTSNKKVPDSDSPKDFPPNSKSTQSIKTATHTETMNRLSSINDTETGVPAMVESSADDSRGNDISVSSMDGKTSLQFEEALGESVIHASNKDCSPMTAQMTKELPVAPAQTSIEEFLGVSIDSGELNSLIGTFESTKVLDNRDCRRETPSSKNNESRRNSQLSSLNLENSVSSSATESGLAERGQFSSELQYSPSIECESNIQTSQATDVFHLAKEHMIQSPVEPHGPPQIPPAEPKKHTSLTKGESFADSPIESAPVPATKVILRPAKLVVPSTFEGGWGKKLKLVSSNKPKRRAYVQPLKDYEL